MMTIIINHKKWYLTMRPIRTIRYKTSILANKIIYKNEVEEQVHKLL